MTALEFQIKHRPALAEFLQTEMGQDLMQTLHNLRPAATFGGNEPAASYVLGIITGWEKLEQAIIALSLVPKTSQAQPVQNYGVTEKPKAEKPAA